jgi:hypothetical protein
MVIVPARQATYAGGIHSLESFPGLHKRLQIRAQHSRICGFYAGSFLTGTRSGDRIQVFGQKEQF